MFYVILNRNSLPWSNDNFFSIQWRKICTIVRNTVHVVIAS